MRRRPGRASRALPLLMLALCALLLSACTTTGRIDVPWLRLSLRLPGATATPSAQAQAPDTSTPEPTPGPELTVAQFVPLAEKFVEEHRGLKFKSPVTVTLLDDAAFRQRLLGQGTDTTALTTTSKELVALHLIDRTVDLGSSARDLLGAGVSGFYDPKSKALVVRGGGATPYVRQVMVHELTHALQDQWFNIDRPQLDKTNDEQSLAFQTVVEGDAVRIENEYHDAMTPQEQAQADAEEQAEGSGTDLSSVPRPLVELIAFPYIAGPAFIDQLDQVGGQQQVDDAFVHPPVSTAQVLDVERYLQHTAPRSVPVPRADGTAFDHGVLGEFGLLMLLEDVDGMSAPAAQQVGALWVGDEYVAWDRGSQSCVRLSMLALNSGGQGQVDDALRRYAADVHGTYSAPSASGPATITSCG